MNEPPFAYHIVCKEGYVTTRNCTDLVEAAKDTPWGSEERSAMEVK